MRVEFDAKMPEGWEFDRFDFPKAFDVILGVEDTAEHLTGDIVHGRGPWSRRHIILRRKETPCVALARMVVEECLRGGDPGGDFWSTVHCLANRVLEGEK